MTIRQMTIADVPQVAALEKACFPDPWSLASLLYEAVNTDAVYLVAVDEGILLGYIGMHHVLDEGHITNLAVAHIHRRGGVGRSLLEALIAHTRAQGFAFLTLEVRASNTPAQALYGGLGFAEVGRRRRYYQNPPEDALLMTLTFEERE